MSVGINSSYGNMGGASPLVKFAAAYATGGAAGLGTSALMQTRSPAARMFGMGAMGNNMYDNFSTPDQTYQTSYDNPLGGQDMSDQFGAMGRRLKNQYGYRG